MQLQSDNNCTIELRNDQIVISVMVIMVAENMVKLERCDYVR
jgi:hypothetical protein